MGTFARRESTRGTWSGCLRRGLSRGRRRVLRKGLGWLRRFFAGLAGGGRWGGVMVRGGGGGAWLGWGGGRAVEGCGWGGCAASEGSHGGAGGAAAGGGG